MKVTVVEEKSANTPPNNKNSSDSKNTAQTKPTDSPQKSSLSPEKGQHVLPPLNSSENGEKQKLYSLILDLDETLIHYEDVIYWIYNHISQPLEQW